MAGGPAARAWQAVGIVLALLLLLFAGLGEGHFYGFYAPPGCRQSATSMRALDLIAGRLGFYGTSGDGGSPAALARFRLPRALALDEERELLYVSDADNHAVRVVDMRDPARGGGVIETLLGELGEAGASGDGVPSRQARIRRPNGLAWDAGRQRLYVADEGNHAIRCVDLSYTAEGNATVVAGILGLSGNTGDGNSALEALLDSPAGLALDAAGQRLFFADSGNRRVRVLDLSNGTISAVASEEDAFDVPTGVVYDDSREVLYIADFGRHTVMKVALANGTTTLVAGVPGEEGSVGDGGTEFRGDEGPATEALLKRPFGLALDVLAQRLYVADSANPAVRTVDLPTGLMTVTVHRPGYFSFGVTDDDQGPVGLALTKSRVPGIEVLWTIHANMDPQPWTTEGEYFHFDGTSLKNLVPPGTKAIKLPGRSLPPSIVRYVRQFRRGVCVWIGTVRFWQERSILIGPIQGPAADEYKGGNIPCPDCTATGVRDPPGVCVPAPCEDAEFRWEHGDIVQILGVAPEFAKDTELHTDEAVQMLYMAEGNNHAIRVTNIANPPDYKCSFRLPDEWEYTEGPYA